MNYDYVPISKRNPIHFPDDKRVALIFTFNLETWDLIKDTDQPYYAGGPALLPNMLPGNIPDYPNYTWREYGQRIGIWRLFDLFDEMGVPASCTTNAVTFERRREMVDACLERGWELLAHNYEQGELLTDYAHDIEKEQEVIAASIKMYQRHVGYKPTGWLSSSLRCTSNTAAILVKHGFKYLCDIMNDDQPFMLRTSEGPIVSIPYSNEINDFTILTRRGYSSNDYRDTLIDELDQLYLEGAKTSRIMNVGLHPHVSGRANRIRALREFIEHAKSLSGVWFARRDELADWYQDQHEAHFPGQLKEK